MDTKNISKLKLHRYPNKRVVLIFVLVVLVFCGPVSSRPPAGQPDSDSTLKIYLPRQIRIKEDVITLGDLAIIRGKKSLVNSASEIALGRFSVPGQEIVVDKITVLSRLASNGFSASVVLLTGAEKVTVKQKHRIIKGAEFIDTARLFLKQNPPDQSVCQMEPIGTPKDFILPSEQVDVTLVPELVQSNVISQSNVLISIIADGKSGGVREVTFRLKYKSRRVRTVIDIPAGSVINSENIKIEETVSASHEPAGWKPPYGLVARRFLPADTVVPVSAFGTARKAVIIERNQRVAIRAESSGLLVTAVGTALEKGRSGEYIRVRNFDSKRIIYVKINENGTVEPVY